jgi:hypothetical protein
MDLISPAEIPQPRAAVIKWLLASDPAIRWQVMRDLTHEADDVIAAERARVATEGWGAQLLAEQTPEGHWGDENDSWDLMRTNYALVLLKNFGLDPESEQARKAVSLVRERLIFRWHDNRPFFEGETEPCINGGVMASGSYFGQSSERLLNQLLDEQLEDDGWNCEAPKSQRSSFHTTICVLEGLLEYERANGASTAISDARARGQEYLLRRRMLRSLSTGEVIKNQWTRFMYPPLCWYDVLRGLDYLRNAGVTPDERVDEAVAIVVQRQHQNGRWPIKHPERLYFMMEPGTGVASRWNTLRALRVLDWYARLR